MSPIPIDVPGHPHDYLLEPGALEGLGGALATRLPRTRACLLVADAAVAQSHARVAADSIARTGIARARIEVEAEESNKSLVQAGRLVDAMLQAGLERHDCVVVVGGGLVGDLGGFAASIYKRGIATVLVPTTLLAMVDASIGGKTAVNHALPGGGLGKNLVGTFWQPALIAADPAALRTLPARELRCGLAESVKHALVGDREFLDVLAHDLDAILALDTATLLRTIRRSVAVKIAIVQADPHERGRRAELNLGHTFAHAIEPLPELGLRHGEAVSIGLCAALHCSVRRGLIDAADAARTVGLLGRIGLPTHLGRPVDPLRLIEAMGHDKKNAGGRIRLVLPTRTGATLVDDAAAEELLDAWRAVS